MNEESLGACVEELRKYCPGHQPIWTALGVTRLAFDGMFVFLIVELSEVFEGERTVLILCVWG